MAFNHNRESEYFVYSPEQHAVVSNDEYLSPIQAQPYAKQEFDPQGPNPYHNTYPVTIPTPSSHQRGWSHSTTSTNVSSGKPFLPPTSKPVKERQSGVRTWSLEVVTVFVAIGAFNGNALPEWPYYITLNALIAVLAAVTTAAMNVALQNSMSQLKWIRFDEARTRLSDMEAFDEASRGTWGAVKLLFTARGGFLGSFGATVSIIALLLGPFAQQIVTYQTRNVESHEGASVPRALNYTGALPGNSSSTGFVPILPLKSAVYNGLFAENGRPGAALAFECPSGNCTWDPYDTLAVCGECVDLTPFIQSYCGESSKSGKNCGWQVPQGAKLKDKTEVFSMTSQIPSARGDQPHASIMRFLFMGTEAHDGLAGETKPWARQCTLNTCLQTLSTKVINGVLTEETVGKKTNGTVLDITANVDEEDYNIYIAGENATTYMLGIEAMLSMRGWFATLFASGSASRSTDNFTRTVTDDSVVVNLTVGISSGETFFDSDIVTAFYWNYYQYADGLDMLINDMATSMTVAFRSFNGAGKVAGRAVFTESYVHVLWGFAVVPILVVVGAAVFLIAAAVMSDRKDAQVWKSSALAVMFHGLDDEAKARFVQGEDLRESKILARNVKVRLVEGDDGILLRV
ncbi:hypothetical protein GGS20DRAFT_576364 [Poronia punctata]|nr:hypothetical protein GGS20DRAFT_576364 [Poronia punctata]